MADGAYHVLKLELLYFRVFPRETRGSNQHVNTQFVYKQKRTAHTNLTLRCVTCVGSAMHPTDHTCLLKQTLSACFFI